MNKENIPKNIRKQIVGLNKLKKIGIGSEAIGTELKVLDRIVKKNK